jgi:8-oxo-dGTP pyrophosphatase MutT (NUDIX family)
VAATTGGGGTVVEVSAGGIVVGTVGAVDTGAAAVGAGPQAAIIARVNRAGRLEWCLPKGHVEPGETLAETAVREIAEETGIRGEVVDSLGAIDYWFFADGRRVHKTVHLFLLEAVGGAIGVGDDPDEEAVEAAWVPLTELAERLTFSNERRVARAVAQRLLAAP